MRLIFPPCVVKSLRCRTHFLPPYNSTFLDGPRGRRIERAVEERRTSRERKRDNGRKRERERKRGQTKGLTRPTIRPRQLVKHWPFPRRDCSASPRLEGGHDDACTTGYERDGLRGERRGWSNRRTNKLEIEEKTLLDGFAPFVHFNRLIESWRGINFGWYFWVEDLIDFIFLRSSFSKFYMEYYMWVMWIIWAVKLCKCIEWMSFSRLCLETRIICFYVFFIFFWLSISRSFIFISLLWNFLWLTVKILIYHYCR